MDEINKPQGNGLPTDKQSQKKVDESWKQNVEKEKAQSKDRLEDNGLASGSQSHKLENNGLASGSQSHRLEDNGLASGSQSHKLEDNGLASGSQNTFDYKTDSQITRAVDVLKAIRIYNEK